MTRIILSSRLSFCVSRPGRRDFLLVPSLPSMTCLVRHNNSHRVRIEKDRLWNLGCRIYKPEQGARGERVASEVFWNSVRKWQVWCSSLPAGSVTMLFIFHIRREARIVERRDTMRTVHHATVGKRTGRLKSVSGHLSVYCVFALDWGVGVLGGGGDWGGVLDTFNQLGFLQIYLLVLVSIFVVACSMFISLCCQLNKNNNN